MAVAAHLSELNLGVNMRLRVVRERRWRVLAVCRVRGDCPLVDFLDHLPPNLAKDGRRMLALLGRIADQGPPRNVEVSHQIGAGIWELVRGRLRVLWFHDHVGWSS